MLRKHVVKFINYMQFSSLILKMYDMQILVCIQINVKFIIIEVLLLYWL
jgi:hypothetical protein